MFDIFDTLSLLAASHGASGHERDISRVISDMAAPFADECYTDAMGNLIVRKKGSGNRVMLSAHMDTVGFIATFIDDKGFVRFSKIGGVGPEYCLNAPVVFQGGARGVIRSDGKVEFKDLKPENLYIDVGAPDHAGAAALVSIGDTAVYCSQTYTAGNGIVSPVLDDRVGCLVLLMALERLEKCGCDAWFVFSAQEEVGTRGAKTAAYSIEPKYGIAVDVTGAEDIPEPKSKNGVRLGGGAAIKLMDNSVISSREVVDMLRCAAIKEDLSIQYEVGSKGGTDAGAMQSSKGGVAAGGISLPVRYIHTPCEMADAGDIECCARLLTGFLKQVK